MYSEIGEIAFQQKTYFLPPRAAISPPPAAQDVAFELHHATVTLVDVGPLWCFSGAGKPQNMFISPSSSS
jgi:hypothetical protein